MIYIKKKDFEISHYNSENLKIYSKFKTIYILEGNHKFKIEMPTKIVDIISFNRILRRFTRADKCNVYVISKNPLKLVIIRRGELYTFTKSTKLKSVLKLKNCRNLLHVDICKTSSGELIFGEYGANNSRKGVPIYISVDMGDSWSRVYEFPRNSIKHIHCIKQDPFTNKIWTLTGDKNGECQILVSDIHFKKIKLLGDGSQNWRACNIFFKKKYVFWLMDSPNEPSHLIQYSRKNDDIKIGQKFNGPIWYTTKVNNLYFAGTSVEPGYSSDYGFAELLYSNDLTNWNILKKFKKDNFPISIFKNGVIAFPIVNENLKNFQLFGEALDGIDGKVIEMNLDDKF